jgi:hypothetical protein
MQLFKESPPEKLHLFFYQLGYPFVYQTILFPDSNNNKSLILIEK